MIQLECSEYLSSQTNMLRQRRQYLQSNTELSPKLKIGSRSYAAASAWTLGVVGHGYTSTSEARVRVPCSTTADIRHLHRLKQKRHESSSKELYTVVIVDIVQ